MIARRLAAVLVAVASIGGQARAFEAAISLVLDDSMSMAGDAFAAEISAGSLMIAGCDETISLSLLSLNGSKPSGKPLPVNASRRQELLAELRSLRASGETPLYQAFLNAASAVELSTCETKWIAVLTDGRHTGPLPAELRGPGPVPVESEVVAKLAKRLQKSGIHVLAIGLGDGINRVQLAELASATGGRFVAVKSAGELVPEFVAWLRMIGGYYMIEGSEAAIVAGDSNFKMFAALDASQSLEMELDGRALKRGDARFECWKDAAHQLFVAQAASPPPGLFRVQRVAQSNSGRVYFLKRAAPTWGAQFDPPADDASGPFRIALHSGDAARLRCNAVCTVREINAPHSASLQARLKLNASGKYEAEIPVGEGIGAIRAGQHDAELVVEVPGGWRQTFARTFSIKHRAELDVALEVASPRRCKLLCGERKTLRCSLSSRSREALPAGVALQAELKSAPAEQAAPRVALRSAKPGQAVVRQPLAARNDFDVDVEVPHDVPPGEFNVELVVSAVADGRRVLVNGRSELRLPVSIETDLVSGTLQILDAAGRPLPENVLTCEVLSPIRPTTVQLVSTLIGDFSLSDVQFSPPRIEGEIAAHLQVSPGHGTERDQVIIEMHVPAQSAPGERRFEFSITPRAGLRLDETSRRLLVSLVIPEPKIHISKGVLHRQLGLWEWLGRRASPLPDWSGELPVIVSASGLNADVECRVGGILCKPADQPVELTIPIEGIACDGDGTYPLHAPVECTYGHAKIMVAGGDSAKLGPSESVYIGDLEVLPPSTWPLYAIVAGALALTWIYRQWRGRVPGRLVMLNNEQRQIVLGRRGHRLRIGNLDFALRRRWGVVQIKLVSKGDVSAELLSDAGSATLMPGDWEPFYAGDRLQVDNQQAEYFAGPRRKLSQPLSPELMHA